MPTTPTPELDPKRKPKPEIKPPRKPEPELKHPRKPEPEIKQPAVPAKPEVGEDQGDSGPDRENPITEQSKHRTPVDREDARPARVGPEDGHLGATEEQVSDTTAPSGDAFKDEPRQG
jgi:hypothetical protein